MVTLINSADDFEVRSHWNIVDYLYQFMSPAKITFNLCSPTNTCKPQDPEGQLQLYYCSIKCLLSALISLCFLCSLSFLFSFLSCLFTLFPYDGQTSEICPGLVRLPLHVKLLVPCLRLLFLQLLSLTP